VKILWSWLLELCDLDQVPSVEEGARALTRGGIEIEGMTNLGAGFRGVVVAEVVAKRPHPQADKLTLVDVITERGGTATQVVCGASNVPAPGRKVLWAQIGAQLPNGLTLAAKPVKGIESPGMLCAEDELGLSDDHAGIVVLDADDTTPLGAPAQRALGIDDWLLEVNAPANRGDLLGHVGVARELVAMLRGKLVLPDADLSAYSAAGNAKVEIAIASAEDCPRYTARIIDGVTVKPSPRRIAQRLRAVGVRPISNLVDVTNYVMFELGQPLHAFDAAKLKTGVVGVSPAADGEKLTTLDNVERTLVKTDLMIRDGDRGIALAGVMGGADTEVTDSTTRVLLESASFRALAVRRTARRLGLHSEASYRFERGVDPELASFASARAARLLCMLGSGKVIGSVVDAYPGKRDVKPIKTRLSRVQVLTGVPLTDTACRDALERLGFAVTVAQQELTVTPPSVRTDVVREVDVIEEILRVTGYEQVPSTLPVLRQGPPVQPADRADLARRALAAAGAAEAITFGFQSVERVGALGLAATDRRAQPIVVRNPMSIDQAVMRTSLLPNLIAAIARNQSYGRGDVALFEVGSVFLRKGERVTEGPIHELADEPLWAAGVLAGKRPGHIGDGSAWDAFDAKALALETIRAVAGDVRVRVNAVNNVSYLHPGIAGELVIDPDGRSQSGHLHLGRDVVGRFGELHPDVREKLGVSGSVFAFEVEIGKLPLASPAQMRTIPRFPGSERDVSLLLAEGIAASRIVDVIEAANEPLVSRIRLLEDYRDAKLGAGMKSMLWSIAYRAPDRTLTDVEVDKAHENLVARLVENLPAQRR
jgi:phenylalanyl-tRNA synthetase beta chain